MRWHRLLMLAVVLTVQENAAFWMAMDERVDYDVAGREAFLEEGSNITITCTVKAEDKTTDDLRIKFVDVKVNETDIEISEDKKRAKITLTDLKVDSSRHNQIFRCILPDYKELGLLPKHVSLQVGRQPLQPRDVSCIVHQWETLKCKWLPSAKDQTENGFFSTAYSMAYIQDDEVGSLDCPQFTETKDGCTWDETDYTFGLPIRLNITVRNKLGNKTINNVYFNTYKIVQPGRVSSINMSRISSRDAEITWLPPSHHNMTFSVTVTCQWHTFNLSTFATQVKLEDLIPHTNYTVTIRAIPAQGGFWSEPTSKRFTTQQDVPEDHPMVARGAYEVGQCGKDCRNVTIYYRPLHEKLANGKDLRYTMMVKAEEPCDNSLHVKQGDVYKLNTSSHHMNIPCRTSCSIRISISASNAKGMPLWPPDEIVIPSNGSMFAAPTPVVKAVNDSTVNLSWSSVDDAESYTVYWCRGGAHGCHPKHELNWKVIPNVTNKYLLDLGPNANFDNMKFALSVIVKNHSSPLSWARCAFDNRQGGEVPSLEVSTHQKFRSAAVRWTVSECPMGNRRGFISGFNLSFCEVDKCPVEEQLHDLQCMGIPKSLFVERHLKDFCIEGLEADKSFLLKISSLSEHGQSEWSGPVCHTVTDTWFRGAAIFGVAIGGVLAIILIILGIITIIYKFKSFHKWYTGMDIIVPERHMTFSSVSSSKHLINEQQRAAIFSRGMSTTDSEQSGERQRAYSCSTDFGEDDVFSTSLQEDDEIQACRSPNGYITVDAKSKHGYQRADSLNMANRALPVRPLSQVPEEGDSKEKQSNTCGKQKKSRSSSKSSKGSRGSKNSRSSVTEQSEFPPVSHVIKNPHYAIPMNNNLQIHAV